MSTLPDRIDRALRALLRLPGLVVEWVDGDVVVQDDVEPDDVVDDVRRTAAHPEAHLALEDGLHYVRHDGHVLAYEHRGRTAFGIGGVNAEGARKSELLRVFRSRTDRHGLVRQLVFPVRGDELDDVVAAGFEAVQVGVEAWLDLADFSFRGNRFEHVRQMRNRAGRRGVVVEEVGPDTHRHALERLHATWLAAKRPSWRMKLLVGSPSLDRPFDRRYLVARTADRIEGFCTLLPGPDGVWGVDVMVRRPDAVPGTMELLLGDAAMVLKAEGATQLSLGPCPMAGVPFSWRRPVLTAVFRLLYDHRLGNRVFGFRSLHRFKAKFRPRWEPVHIAAAPRLGVMAMYRGCRMWGLY